MAVLGFSIRLTELAGKWLSLASLSLALLVSDVNWDFSMNHSHNSMIRHCEVFDAKSAEDRGNRGTLSRMDERPLVATAHDAVA